MVKAGDYTEKISVVGALLPVDFLSEEGTRFEGENFAGNNGERLAGLRISPGPVAFLLNNKLAEAGKFDFLAGSQGFLDDGQNGLNDPFSFFSLKVAVDSNIFYQVFFGHRMDFYHKSHGNGKKESPEGSLHNANPPVVRMSCYFFLAGFFFFD